jgi:hypothetical protein
MLKSITKTAAVAALLGLIVLEPQDRRGTVVRIAVTTLELTAGTLQWAARSLDPIADRSRPSDQRAFDTHLPLRSASGTQRDTEQTD